jgi:Misato Segment II tubulin-like domain
MSRRETIQLSLGPTANSVTAHLLNLEGLAVTSCNAQPSVCDPYVTHRRDQVWVPRVILVDESHRLHQHRKKEDNLPESQETLQTATSSTWSGTVQKVDLDTFSLDAFSASTGEDVVANFSWNSNVMPQQPKPAWLASWQQAANQLAYAPYSPYRLPEHEQQQQQQQHHSKQQSSRHFSWDDMGEEPEQDEEGTAALRERQEQEQRRQWEGERQRFEEDMSNLWKESPPTPEPEGNAPAGEALSSSVPTEADLAQLSWMDYWMPPHPNPISRLRPFMPSILPITAAVRGCSMIYGTRFVSN